MHCIHSCSSCNVKLRIPLNRGILVIICPNCNNRFEFDSNQGSSVSIENIPKSSPIINIPKLPRLDKNRVIGFILFFILGIYIIRGLNSPADNPKDNKTIFQDDKENSPEKKPDLKIDEKPAPFSI